MVDTVRDLKERETASAAVRTPEVAGEARAGKGTAKVGPAGGEGVKEEG